MDTGIIVLVVIVVLVVVALLVLLPRLRGAQEAKRLQAKRQEAAGRHHAEADQKLAHAEQIERSAEAERAEAELAERQAAARRAEVEMAERKAEAARAEANVSRSAADRTERGLADDEIGLGGEVRRERVTDVREERVVDDGTPGGGRFVRDERTVDPRDEPAGSGGARHPGAPLSTPRPRRVVALEHAEPLDVPALLAFLGARAVAGVEELTPDGAYRRTLRLPHGPGVVALRAGGGVVEAELYVHPEDEAAGDRRLPPPARPRRAARGRSTPTWLRTPCSRRSSPAAPACASRATWTRRSSSPARSSASR